MKADQRKCATIDPTVQARDICFPTDARSHDRVRQRAVRVAKLRVIALRQNDHRMSKQMQAQQSRYAHAKQLKRARRCTKKLQTFLGRVSRDVQNNTPHPDSGLQSPLTIATRIRNQRMDRNRLKGTMDGRINAILSAAGMNSHKLVRLAKDPLRQILFGLRIYPRAWS